MLCKSLTGIGFLLFSVFLSPVYGTDLYSGTLVDAHSQVRCDIHPREVSKIVDKLPVDYVLLSAGGCNKKEEFFANLPTHLGRVAEVTLQSDKLFFMSGMKHLTVKSQWNPKFLKPIFSIGEQANYVGTAEILIQHAVWDDPRLQSRGVNLNLLDPNLEVIIQQLKSRSLPVILHVEFNDASDLRDQTVDDLNVLLEEHSDHPFVLIHMGQSSPELTASLLDQNNNLYFLTSMTSGFFQIVSRGKTFTTQSGWETFFKVENKSLAEHMAKPSWRPEWLGVINKHPTKFILAFDSVFKGTWRNRYPKELQIIRRAFADLDPVKAKRIACGNAQKLWRLPIECLAN